jgi:hypothetical protein
VTAATGVGVATYVYGIARVDVDVDGRTGVSGGDVRTVEHRGLAALVSDVPPGTVRAKRRDLLAHSDVLQAAFGGGAVLPFRFGTVFDDDDTVVDELLAPRYDELVRLLKSFDGLSELTVKADFSEDAVLAEIVRDDPQVARLRAQGGRDVELGEAVARALAARRERAAAHVLDTLEPLAREVSVDELRGEYELLRASFLVERAQLEPFDARMDELAREHAGTILFRYVGPLPPHSFVRLGGT